MGGGIARPAIATGNSASDGLAPCPAAVTPEHGSAADEPAEEDWSWQRVVLDGYSVRGADVLGIGNFSVVRRGTDVATGTQVAVKCLQAKHASELKFRREVFLFGSLVGQRPGEVCDDTIIDGKEAASDGVEACGEWQLRRGATLVDSERESLAQDLASLPTASDMLVRLLDYSPLVAACPDADRYVVLELGLFTLRDLILHCRDEEKKKARHSLKEEVEMIRVMVHVLQALAYLHSHLFIHGDLKPANVMWFSDKLGGRWKVIDLDGLRTASELVDMKDADFYTAIYAAPELARAVAAKSALRLSRRLDVWALGACVLEMELLAPIFDQKFAELAEKEEDCLQSFMLWLGDEPEPVLFPSAPRILHAELRSLLQQNVLVGFPNKRGSPTTLLASPILGEPGRLALISGAPPPTVTPEPLVDKPAQKTPTAWQLYQEAHRAELEAEGWKPGKAVAELHRRWRILLAEGGEELEMLQLREAELRQACAS